MVNKAKIIIPIFVIAIVAAGLLFFRKPAGEPEVTAPDSLAGQQSAVSQVPAATGNPDQAMDVIIQSASQEQAASAQTDEVNSITSSDQAVNNIDGVYNENEY